MAESTSKSPPILSSRDATVSFLEGGGGEGGITSSLTTSKAVLVSVIAPCVFQHQDCHSGGPTEELDVDATETSSSSSHSDEAPQAGNLSASVTDNGRGAMVGTSTRSVLEANEEDAVPMRDGTSEREDSQEITMEESLAVKREEDNPHEAEINIEELLRIAFQGLLDEYYLLNVPTFSRVEDKKVIQVPIVGSMTNLDDINGQPIPWIRVEAMALPTSLGIILDRLERIGVGTHLGTVAVYKVELCRTASPYLEKPDEKPKEEAVGSDSDAETQRGFNASTATGKKEEQDDSEHSEKIKSERLIEEARAEWKNAATRLRIEQIREQIGEQAALSFDFLSLLTIAGILAGVGLVTNNTVVIVASMLVSPIMGPVLGLTFGTQVKDWPLVAGSFINESVALAVCLFIGILMGLCVGFTDLAEKDWPTNEMEIRGDPIGLLTGLAVAIPSGAGVCLSVIGGNTSSLVGVAISASLLPPAVNAGICFMYSLLMATGTVENDSDFSAVDFARIGAISFALTVLNILCIWLSGIFMFHIKEVSPAQNKGAFWARDIRVARELNEKGKAGDNPPPVDTSVLKKGIMSALSKKRLNDEEQPSPGKQNLKTVKIKPPHAQKAYPRTFPQPANLNTAFAFKPKRKSAHASKEALWWNDLVEHDAAGEERQEEDAHYVNLDELSNLLGIGSNDDDDDDEDDVIAPIKLSRYGGGRYI